MGFDLVILKLIKQHFIILYYSLFKNFLIYSSLGVDQFRHKDIVYLKG